MPVHLTSTSLRCKRKPEYLEKTHVDPGRACKRRVDSGPSWEPVSFLINVNNERMLLADLLLTEVIYLACSYATVYLIYLKFKATYDGNHDTFRVEFLVVPVGGLSFLVNHDFSPLEILWTFSIYLESVAILPQLFMISKTGEAETITTHYLFFLGLYRALYLVNWIWRFYFEGFFDLIAVVAGVVQTILYCDFFYLYITKGMLDNLSSFAASFAITFPKMTHFHCKKFIWCFSKH
uniref:ER lumen protein-retaining receptor n=1 Tax=Piliocolobus tephrosceles TaxID=591936 RepID=A0A8C9G9K2_9PRIM